MVDTPGQKKIQLLDPNHLSIDGLQPTCMYQLRVKRGPQDFSLGLALVELVKNTW
jgi:hypothetical protein